MIRGVGPVYAKKLVRAFGDKVFDDPFVRGFANSPWTGCCIYINASKSGAAPCCCAYYAPRLDG
jgi:hypothetical protein